MRKSGRLFRARLTAHKAKIAQIKESVNEVNNNQTDNSDESKQSVRVPVTATRSPKF